MSRRERLWWLAAVAFTLINLAGAVLAAANNEQFHTRLHVFLLLVGGYFVWRLLPKRSESV